MGAAPLRCGLGHWGLCLVFLALINGDSRCKICFSGLRLANQLLLYGYLTLDVRIYF